MAATKNSSRSALQHAGHKSTLILNDKKESVANYTLRKPSDLLKRDSAV